MGKTKNKRKIHRTRNSDASEGKLEKSHASGLNKPYSKVIIIHERIFRGFLDLTFLVQQHDFHFRLFFEA